MKLDAKANKIRGMGQLWLWWVLLWFACVGSLNAQQNEQYVPPDRTTLLQAARHIMEKVRYCAFITVDSSETPRARIVDAFAPDSQMVVWVATNPRTRKVKQIQRNPRVTLFYWDPDGISYVAYTGTATLVSDPREKARHWKEAWKNFYQDRWRGEDYVLIRIQPTRIEVVSYEFGILNEPTSWRPPAVEFK